MVMLPALNRNDEGSIPSASTHTASLEGLLSPLADGHTSMVTPLNDATPLVTAVYLLDSRGMESRACKLQTEPKTDSFVEELIPKLLN